MLILVFTGDVIAFHFTNQANKSDFFQVDHELWTLQIQLTMSGSLGLLAIILEREVVINPRRACAGGLR